MNRYWEDSVKIKDKGDKDMTDKKEEKEANPLKRESCNDHYVQRSERVYERLMDLERKRIAEIKRKEQERNEEWHQEKIKNAQDFKLLLKKD